MPRQGQCLEPMLLSFSIPVWSRRETHGSSFEISNIAQRMRFPHPDAFYGNLDKSALVQAPSCLAVASRMAFTIAGLIGGAPCSQSRRI